MCHAAGHLESMKLLLKRQSQQRCKGKVITEGKPGKWPVGSPHFMTQAAVDRLVGVVFFKPKLWLKGLDVSEQEKPAFCLIWSAADHFYCNLFCGGSRV